MAFVFTDDNFDDTALKGGVSVVDCWAEWCGPCRLIAPIIDDLAHEYDGKVTIGKLDIDQNDKVSIRYNIRSIPTVLIFKDGELVDKHVGLTTKAALESKIKTHLN
ncbi:MAG: thioredoxin [Lewinellaceae bacterium]|nr:thioredoxin [Lewinellaceae bacterium]